MKRHIPLSILAVLFFAIILFPFVSLQSAGAYSPPPSSTPNPSGIVQYDPNLEPDPIGNIAQPLTSTILRQSSPRIGNWTNAPMAIPSSGFVGYPQRLGIHNGVDIWTYNNTSGTPPGNIVYLAYQGKLTDFMYDYQGHKNGIVFEHTIDSAFASYVPQLHVYTLYFHMAKQDDYTPGQTYINSSLQANQTYPMGTILGQQGNARYGSNEDTITHLHFCVSSTKSCANALDINAYLGPDLTYPAPNWMDPIEYNGNGGSTLHPPSNLSASAVNSYQVYLTWTASPDAPSNIDGYRIYRDGVAIGNRVSTDTSTNVYSLAACTTYSFYLTAYRGSSESSASNTVSATTQGCGNPTGDIFGYVKDSNTGSGISGTLVTLSGATTSQTTTDGNGRYSFSGVQSGSVSIGASKSGYTNNSVSAYVYAYSSNQASDIYLSPNASQTGDVFGYIKDSNTGMGISGALVTYQGVPTSQAATDSSGYYSFSGKPAGTVTISASRSGYSSNSTSVYIYANASTRASDIYLTPNQGVPSPPTLSSPGNGSSNPPNYDINFQWYSSSGATEYLLEWWGGPYSTMQPCGWSSATSCYNGPAWTDNTYFWHVRARNSTGTSDWSDTWSFYIQGAVPTAPSNLRVTSTTQSSVSIAWNDNSSNENGFKIYRWNGNTGSWDYWSSVGANVTSFTDYSVSCGSTYYYEVSAYNNSGESSVVSTYLTANTGSCVSIPQPPTLSSPGNGSSNAYNYDLTFSWYSSLGATEYQIEWWGGPYSTMQPCSWSSSNSCYIGPVATGNTYYWHVRARNNSGTSNWSDTWSFYIQPQVTNDDIANATQISGPTFTTNQDTTYATTSSDDPAFSCGSRNQGAVSVWYRYTPSSNGTLSANTVGSGYDTVLAVWSGTRNSLTGIACDDDSGGNFTSALTTQLNSGTTYYIEIAGYSSGARGNLSLSVAFSPTQCYSLSTSVNPGASGNINASPAPNCNNGTQYASGTNVTLTANANSGYTFNYWSGDVNGASNPTTVSMNSNRSITGNFSQTATQGCYPRYGTIALKLNPSSIQVQSNQTFELSVVVQTGADQLVSIGTGFNFDSNMLEVKGITPGNTLNVILANSYDNNTGTIRFDAGTFGSPPSGTFTLVTFQLQARSGNGLATLAFTCSQTMVGSVNGPYDILGSADNATITVGTLPTCYSLSTSINPSNRGGINVSPSPNCNNGTQYASGTNVTLTATANSESIFSNWAGDASGASNPMTIIMNGNRNVIGNFTGQGTTPTRVFLPFIKK